MTKLLKEVGVAVDATQLKTMMANLSGRPVHEIIAEGRGKMASMPAGGAAGKYN